MRYATLSLVTAILIVPATAFAQPGGKPAANGGKSVFGAKAKVASTAADAGKARPLLTPAAAAAAAEANKRQAGTVVPVAPIGPQPIKVLEAGSRTTAPGLRGSATITTEAAPEIPQPSRGRPVPLLGQQVSRSGDQPLPGLQSLN